MMSTPGGQPSKTLYDAPDGSDRMIFHEPCGLVQRAVFFFGGAMTFLAPWELLIRPGHPFELGKLPFWFISAGAMSIGIPLLIAAILGVERTLVIDFAARRFEEHGRGRFGLRILRALPFEQLDELAVVEETWSDGPSQWLVEARFGCVPKPLPIRTLVTESGAKALLDAIERRSVEEARGAPPPTIG